MPGVYAKTTAYVDWIHKTTGTFPGGPTSPAHAPVQTPPEKATPFENIVQTSLPAKLMCMKLNTKPKRKYNFTNSTIKAPSHTQSQKYADMSKFVGASHWPVGKLAGQEPVPVVATTTVASTTLSNPFNSDKKKNKKWKKKKFKNARFEEFGFDDFNDDESTSRIVGGKATRAIRAQIILFLASDNQKFSDKKLIIPTFLFLKNFTVRKNVF